MTRFRIQKGDFQTATINSQDI